MCPSESCQARAPLKPLRSRLEENCSLASSLVSSRIVSCRGNSREECLEKGSWLDQSPLLVSGEIQMRLSICREIITPSHLPSVMSFVWSLGLAWTAIELDLPVSLGGSSVEPDQGGRRRQSQLRAENMRREGYEFSVSPPSVLYRKVNGQRHEPLEEVVCEVDDTHAGAVMQALSLRRAELQEMVPLSVSASLMPHLATLKMLTFLQINSAYLVGFQGILETVAVCCLVHSRACRWSCK